VAFPDHTLHVIELSDGAATVFTPGGSQLFGGAFSPDGTRFAFVSATNPSSGRLMIADTGSHGLSALRTFGSNSYDVPRRWLPEAMAGMVVVGFSDAGPTTVVRLDPSTGARLAATDIAGSAGPAISPDGVHAAVSRHLSLGGDADSPGGPGPAQPFNTLRSLVVGAAPVDVFQQPHHQVVPLALSDNGDTICYADDPAAGGFAGVTLSDSLGLFLRSGSSTTQLAHWDSSRWDAAVFVGSAVAAANHTASAEKLLLVAAGGASSTLDSVGGGDQPVFLGTA
jgi:hypothetical protein